MNSRQLLIFDFDGVIVDGMNEYWWSARKACLKLLGDKFKPESLPHAVPHTFSKIRPWVHQGWEMVLLAAEFLRPESHLLTHKENFLNNHYQSLCNEALDTWGWRSDELQSALDEVRTYALENHFATWLSLHKPFPGVIQRLKSLGSEDIDVVVLTTKGTAFTAELLNHFKFKPNLLFGHEFGNKAEVILELKTTRTIKGFIEDRRETLETIQKTPGLESLTCYLASWGYLKPSDTKSLPAGIQILKTETLSAPLASWP